MNEVAFGTFRALFRREIRTALNWRRFRREQWPVHLEVVDRRLELGRFALPWYFEGEKPAGVFSLDGERKQVQWAAANLGKLPGSAPDKILALAGDFSGSPVMLPMAAYGVEKRRVLLDGCHRSIALWLSGAEFAIALFTVMGPVDAGAALDLEHHGG